MTITAENLSKSYKTGRRDVTALHPADIGIEGGRVTLITGRSGSGKTTLVNILSGLITPTSGSVTYDGRDIFTLSDSELSRFRSSDIGYIPQGHSALSSLTVRENILLPASLAKTENAGQKADELISLTGLTGLEKAYPDELSGGELRRLSAARALINSPAVVFADEPTNDLDDENTHLLLTLLRDTASNGAAVIIVSHDRAAAEYADTVYRIDGGHLSLEKGCKRDIA